MTEARNIGPLTPWVCSYTENGDTYGIILYATDPDQIEEDHEGFVVEGQLLGTSEQ